MPLLTPIFQPYVTSISSMVYLSPNKSCCRNSYWSNGEFGKKKRNATNKNPGSPLPLRYSVTLKHCGSRSKLIMIRSCSGQPAVSAFSASSVWEKSLNCSTESSFDKHSDLAISDLALDNHTHPSFIVVKLKQSKTDQFRKGAQIVVGRTDNDICPVAALLHFISSRGTAEGPLFCFQNGKFLTKLNFIPHIRRALSTLGYDSHHYAGHSFRIGAASTAAKANLEDSMIRTLGRWESDAFLSYIRTPASQLTGISRTLSLVP